MQVEEYENLLENQDERLPAHIFRTNYQRLCPQSQEWVRGRVITNWWTEYAAHDPVEAA